MPRVKSDAERGYIGAWMRRERLRLGWSEQQVVDDLARLGQPVRGDYYRQIEAGSGGKKPGPELLAALVMVFGSQPTPPPAETAMPDGNAIVGALKEIVAELARIREAQEETAVTVGQLVGLAGRLIPGGLPAALADGALDGTPK